MDAQAIQDPASWTAEGLLKVAILGAGHMGRFHAAKFAARRDCRLIGIVDVDRKRAEALAETYHCPAFNDCRAVFGMADAAVVSVPTERHHAVAGACLEAGLHVLVEKPLAVDLVQSDALLALARRTQRVLQVGHVERHNSAFRAVSRCIERPLYIEAERLGVFRRRGADVDVVLDLMIHDLDLALILARCQVAAVSACGFPVITSDIDIANARVEFANGCVASLSASRVSQSASRKLRVFQPGLYVSADLQTGRLRYARRSRSGDIETTDEVHNHGDALAAQAEAFVRAIAAGEAGMQDRTARAALELAIEVRRLAGQRLERFL